MDRLRFRDEVYFGIPVLDGHHRDFLSVLNGLIEVDESGNGSMAGQEAADVISFLDGYVTYHFAAEERFMVKYNYPKITMHIAQHDIFTDNLTFFKTNCIQGGENIALRRRLKEQLVYWFHAHEEAVDGELCSFLREKEADRRASTGALVASII